MTLREPWARAKSCFEREIAMYHRNVASHGANFTIGDFVATDYVSANTLKYGPYNRDNFAVWSLAGCGYDADGRDPTRACPRVLNRSHLDAAIGALDLVTHVFVLEDFDRLDAALDNFTFGGARAFPQAPTTNNKFSPFYGTSGTSGNTKQGPDAISTMDDYAPRYYADNHLDAAIYDYARDLVKQRWLERF